MAVCLRAIQAYREGRWGAAPNPGRGLSPLHPAIGASPQGRHVFGLLSLHWLRVPIWGCAPKPRASRLAWSRIFAESEAANKEQDPHMFHHFLNKPKGHGARTRRDPCLEKSLGLEGASPLSGASFSRKEGSKPRSSRGVLGRSPKGERKAKAEWIRQILAFFGAKPQLEGCRGLSTLLGSGAKPQRPSTPHNRFKPIAEPPPCPLYGL